MRKEALTPKQNRFVSEYLIDLNQTAAARRAGYQGDENTLAVTGHRLLRNNKVALAIQQAHAKRQQRTELSQDYVVNGLLQNHRRAMQAEPVYDRKGEPTGEYQYQGAVANKALELLGRHQNMFVDRSTSLNYNVTLESGRQVDLQIQNAFNQLPLDELVDVIQNAVHYHEILALPSDELRRFLSRMDDLRNGRIRLAENGVTVERAEPMDVIDVAPSTQAHTGDS